MDEFLPKTINTSNFAICVLFDVIKNTFFRKIKEFGAPKNRGP